MLIQVYISIFMLKVINRDPRFKVGNHMRISKYKNSFVKCCTSNWSEKVFAIKKS